MKRDGKRPGIGLRPSRPEDRHFLFQVYAADRAGELAAAGLAPDQLDRLLEMQFSLQHRQILERHPQVSMEIILVDQRDAGRLYTAETDREILILDIALLPPFRNQGIGTRLLNRMIKAPEAESRPISLHVAAGNPARNLYQRLGFRPVKDLGVYQQWERVARTRFRGPRNAS